MAYIESYMFTICSILFGPAASSQVEAQHDVSRATATNLQPNKNEIRVGRLVLRYLMRLVGGPDQEMRNARFARVAAT